MKHCTSGLALPAAWTMLSLALQACATADPPMTQTVQIETPGCLHAACEVRNDAGRWQLPSTPGVVTLTTSKSALQVRCRAEGGELSTAGAPPSLQPTSGQGAAAGAQAGGATGGAVFGGTALAFVPVLGVIIVATSVAAGAAAGQAAESQGKALRYPDRISLPMDCRAVGSVSAAQASASAPFGFRIRGLSSAETRDAGLGTQAAVVVTSVPKSGTADAAGLRSGDLILTADEEALRDAAELEERVHALAPDVPLTLQVLRNGQLLQLVLIRRRVVP